MAEKVKLSDIYAAIGKYLEEYGDYEIVRENPLENFTDGELNQYPVYEIDAGCAYAGKAYVAAETAEEANKSIHWFKDYDKGNIMDSRGYSDCSARLKAAGSYRYAITRRL